MIIQLWRMMKGKPQWYALWLFHHKFIIGVCGVILNEDGEVLLQRHRFWPQGSWGLPSGYAEHGETVEQTLVREVKEETDYNIEVTQVLQVKSGFQLRMEVHLLGRFLGGDLHLDEKEVIEARFFSPQELPEGILPSHRGIIAVALDSTHNKNLRSSSL
jgi:8-oxo-dGTP diphosphatase